MKPYLKNKRTREVERAVTRRLTQADLADLLRLQELALSEPADPSLFFPLQEQDYLQILNQGQILGVFANSGLCAACAVHQPGDGAHGMGNDIGIPAEELSCCAVIEAVFVAPDYRGNGLARELILNCVRFAGEALGARHVLAAVSPKSIAAVLSFMSVNGMRIRALRQKQGCRLRYILCHTQGDPRLFTFYERYEIHNIYAISKALANRQMAIATFRGDEGIFIWLAR